MMASAIAAIAGPAAAEGPYAAALGGYAFKADDEWALKSFAESGEIETDSGTVFGGAFGYAFDRAPIGRFRIEAEVSYAASDIESVHSTAIPGFPASGDTRSIAGMANLRVDIGDITAGKAEFRPYVGAGAGVASVKIDYAVDGAFISIVPAVFPLEIDDSDIGFAWQAMAGVDAAVSDSVSVFVEGRYVGVPSVSVMHPGFGELETERNRVAAIIGLRVRL